jgi:hypothetical protein
MDKSDSEGEKIVGVIGFGTAGDGHGIKVGEAKTLGRRDSVRGAR